MAMTLTNNKCQIAKNYLLQIRTIKQRIFVLEEREKELEERSRFISSKTYDNDKVRKSGTISKTEEYVTLLDDCRGKIVREHIKLLKLEEVITEQVHTMPHKPEQMLLELRYVQCMTNEQAAEVMGFSDRHCRRVCQLALEHFFDRFLDDTISVEDSPF